MINEKSNERKSQCEDCLYYDYDFDEDAYVCTLSLDEDEMFSFITKKVSDCQYYKQYDEYKSVRRQN